MAARNVTGSQPERGCKVDIPIHDKWQYLHLHAEYVTQHIYVECVSVNVSEISLLRFRMCVHDYLFKLWNFCFW